MNPQPDAWVGAIGGLFVMGFVSVAIWRGIVTGVRSEQDWDTFKLGEIYDEGKPYYSPSPTNFMRASGHGNGALRRKNGD